MRRARGSGGGGRCAYICIRVGSSSSRDIKESDAAKCSLGERGSKRLSVRAELFMHARLRAEQMHAHAHLNLKQKAEQDK